MKLKNLKKIKTEKKEK